jgi:glutaredoxin
MKTLILYSKPGCHLCEGLQAKLEALPLQLEIRDITQNQTWFQKYQYEVPVLCQLLSAPQASEAAECIEHSLPRVSPRASIQQVAQMLQKHIGPFEA